MFYSLMIKSSNWLISAWNPKLSVAIFGYAERNNEIRERVGWLWNLRCGGGGMGRSEEGRCSTANLMTETPRLFNINSSFSNFRRVFLNERIQKPSRSSTFHQLPNRASPAPSLGTCCSHKAGRVPRRRQKDTACLILQHSSGKHDRT